MLRPGLYPGGSCWPRDQAGGPSRRGARGPGRHLRFCPSFEQPAGLRGPRICTPPGPRRVIGAPGDAARGVCGERGGSQARHLLRVTDLRRGRAGAASLYPGWRGRETAGAGQPCGFAGRPPCLWASRGAAFRTRSSPRSEGRHLLGSLLCQQPSHTGGSQGGRGKGSGFPWMIP